VFAASTGDADFEGFETFKNDLPSPLAHESWFLAWGPNQSANGYVVRVRVYAFDGMTFRTVWQRDGLLNAKLRKTTSGFIIDHVPRESSHEVHDEYVLTPDGPLKIN